MRKVLLSLIVIGSFISYAWYIRVKSVTHVPALAPKTFQSTIPVHPTPLTPPTVTPIPVSSKPTGVLPTAQPNSPYKDGTYTGSSADAFYGNIQVQVTISGGRISTIQFLQAPNDRSTSVEINQQADPMLAQEAIQTQSATVDIISGATDTSQAFIQSMQSALSQAKS